MSGPTIVQVITSGEAGGGQLVSLRVARALVERGCTVRFATPGLGAFTRLCEGIGEVDVIPENTLRDIPRAMRLSSYLKRVEADLVHTHTPIASTILWRFASRLAKVPLVDHVHIANFYGPRGLKSFVARLLDRTTLGIPARYVAVSGDTSDGLVREGYPQERLTTIYNSIPWPRGDRVAPATDEPVIGCIGRISPVKGQLELIEAFSRIRGRYPGARLWIIGYAEEADRSYLKELEARVGALGISELVKFWGYRDDVRALTEQLAVLVLPSRHEAFPLVLLEAMSVGVPVIATRVGGVQELVEDHVSGLLVDPGDAAALDGALSTILGDTSLRERLSRTAYEHVWNRFDDTSTLDPLVSLIMAEAMHARRD